MYYSRTSHNGPSEKRTTSLQRTLPMIRIEITLDVIHSQPPRSGRFRIPDSGHDSRSRPHFSVQKVSLNSGHQETTPSKLAFISPRKPAPPLRPLAHALAIMRSRSETLVMAQVVDVEEDLDPYSMKDDWYYLNAQL